MRQNTTVDCLILAIISISEREKEKKSSQCLVFMYCLSIEVSLCMYNFYMWISECTHIYPNNNSRKKCAWAAKRKRCENGTHENGNGKEEKCRLVFFRICIFFVAFLLSRIDYLLSCENFSSRKTNNFAICSKDVVKKIDFIFRLQNEQFSQTQSKEEWECESERKKEKRSDLLVILFSLMLFAYFDNCKII